MSAKRKIILPLILGLFFAITAAVLAWTSNPVPVPSGANSVTVTQNNYDGQGNLVSQSQTSMPVDGTSTITVTLPNATATSYHDADVEFDDPNRTLWYLAEPPWNCGTTCKNNS